VVIFKVTVFGSLAGELPGPLEALDPPDGEPALAPVPAPIVRPLPDVPVLGPPPG